MKSRGVLVAFTVLILAALACSMPLGNNPAATPSTVPVPALQTEPPTAVLKVTTLVPPTEPAAPTDVAQPTAVPTTPPAVEAPTTPAGLNPVVLLKIDPQTQQASSLRVVDAVTGQTQATSPVNGLSAGLYPLADAKSIFYTDPQSAGVHMASFDGQAHDLAFMTQGETNFSGIFLPSPDGARIAWSKVLSEDSTGTHSQLMIANVDGSNQKTVIDQTVNPPSRPEPVRWSNDGKSLYYTNMPYGIGGYILFYGGPDLVKLDLASGNSTQILKTGCLCSASISPDESLVVYLQKPEADQLNIFVKPVTGGDPIKANLPANHLQAGGIVWAPDGRSFLVTAARGEPDQEAFSVILFHVADMSSIVLIPDDARVLEPALWPAPGVVWLNDNANNAWRMDPANGTLTQTSTGERALAGTR
ncbi:MAG TPA: hypothetical protein VGJ97_13555 [Anaerolineaceae bacterium]|jgi:hypothetical protein